MKDTPVSIRGIIAMFALTAVLFFALRSCMPEPQYTQQHNTRNLRQTDTIYIPGDSFPYYVKSISPAPVSVDTLVVPQEVDYDSILKAFFVALSYADSMEKNDVKLSYNLTVSKNHLDSIAFKIQNTRKTAIITNRYEEASPKRGFFAGAAIGGNAKAFGLGPALLYQDKKDHLYGYYYDAIQNQHHVSAYFKVKF